MLKTWHYRHLLVHDILWPRAAAMPPCSSWLIPPTHWAHSSKCCHTAAAAGEWDRLTDRRTPYHFLDLFLHTLWSVPTVQYNIDQKRTILNVYLILLAFECCCGEWVSDGADCGIACMFACCQVVPGSTPVPSVQRVSAVAEPQDIVDDRDQPLYVNAKQYHRILKRRQARAKLEAAGKIPKERRVCFSILAV